MEQEKREKKHKRGRRGRNLFLCVLQHTALAVVALSLLVMATGSTVRVQGFRYGGTYSLSYADQDKRYEESKVFNSLLGYAAADLIRFGVICGQLETDGVFDGSKVIDVTAYNYRESGLPEQYVTAEYYLEDLLKWANYGFEYSGTAMTKEDEDQFLADMTKVTLIDPESEYYNTSDASYLKSDVASYTFVSDVSANQVRGEEADDDGSTRSRSILINRYKTVQGKNLEEYVSNWELYAELCKDLSRAANSLSYNYNEYVEYGDYYNIKNSNVRYLIAKTVGENTEYYSNLENEKDKNAVIEAMETDADKEDGFFASGRYIYYSPSEMIYQTNTGIEESTIRGLLQEYDYAYPETVRIWISVDTDYPVKDMFTQGAVGFSNYMPHIWQWVAAAIIAGIAYLVLLCHLTAVTGRDTDGKGKAAVRLSAFDKIPTEAALAIALGTAVLAAGILLIVMELAGGGHSLYYKDILTPEFYADAVYADWFKVLLFAGAFVLDAVFTFFFYSLVRRIKARQLWKNSLLWRLAKRIESLVWEVYDNAGIVLRTWIPYAVFCLFNLLMVIIVLSGGSFGATLAVLAAVVVDAAVGILIYHDAKERQKIVRGIETIAGGEVEHQVETGHLHGDNLTLAHSVNNIGKGIKEAVEISMKDERMKADLITNVSHDIKTPLTSIINYVDLIKREEVANEKVQSYIRVLDEKSQRLKQLTDDLVEASKISSGNISLNIERINLTELMNQTTGEFSEKFEQKNLTIVMNVNVKNAVIEADSRRIWRVMENLFNNVYKYAMPSTRVYVSIDSLEQKEKIEISIKNISASPLNCNPEELTERFIRGDVSRTTEGSGLGLSIAKNLTEAQKGTFEIQLDGDLFKIVMTFPLAKNGL